MGLRDSTAGCIRRRRLPSGSAMRSTFPFFLAACAAIICVVSLPRHGFAGPGAGPTPVEVAHVERRVVRRPITFVGTVEASRTSLVASEVAGLVSERLVEEGDHVKKGATLVRLSTDTLTIDLRRFEAAAREARARLWIAEKRYKRLLNLYEKGVASLEDVQGAEAERRAWAAKVSESEAMADRVRRDIEKSDIKAPFSGYVSAEHVEVGEWVGVSEPVVELIDIETVEVVIDVPERYSPLVKRGLKARISFDALPGDEREAEVWAVVPKADPDARSFRVKFRVDNPSGRLVSGMVARVSIFVGARTPVTLVPKDALVDAAGGKLVYVVVDGAARPVPVKISFAVDGMVAVDGALEPGSMVVVRGNERLRPGQPVEVGTK